MLPTVGFVEIANPSLRFARLKYALVYLAGPMANAALVVAGLHWVPETNPNDWFHGILPTMRIFKIYLDQGPALGVILVLANGLAVLTNLFPYRTTVDGRLVYSDGLGLLHFLFATNWGLRQVRFWYFRQESISCATAGQYPEAIRWCEQGLEELPGNVAIQHLHADLLLHCGEFEKAREIWHKLLAGSEDNIASRLAALSNIARADLLIGGPELLAEADSFSAECVQTAPWDSSYQATRGGVLIVSGKLDEGKSILEASRKELTGSSEQACVHSFLALAEARQGQPEEANRQLAEARKLDPKSVTVAVMAPKVDEVINNRAGILTSSPSPSGFEAGA